MTSRTGSKVRANEKNKITFLDLWVISPQCLVTTVKISVSVTVFEKLTKFGELSYLEGLTADDVAIS